MGAVWMRSKTSNALAENKEQKSGARWESWSLVGVVKGVTEPTWLATSPQSVSLIRKTGSFSRRRFSIKSIISFRIKCIRGAVSIFNGPTYAVHSLTVYSPAFTASFAHPRLVDDLFGPRGNALRQSDFCTSGHWFLYEFIPFIP